MPVQKVLDWAASATILLAADGAGRSLLNSGLKPVVIGDLDSFHGDVPDGITVIKDEDQNRTDCDKLLTYAEQLNITKLTLIGLEGDRLDHMLATLSSCLCSSLEIRIVLRRGIGYVLNSGSNRLIKLHRGQRFSLMPIGVAEGVTLKGAEWELENARLALGEQTSISNRARGEIGVSISSGSLLTICETEQDEAPSW
jgi:thiamine pyrophosphokinase